MPDAAEEDAELGLSCVHKGSISFKAGGAERRFDR